MAAVSGPGAGRATEPCTGRPDDRALLPLLRASWVPGAVRRAGPRGARHLAAVSPASPAGAGGFGGGAGGRRGCGAARRVARSLSRHHPGRWPTTRSSARPGEASPRLWSRCPVETRCSAPPGGRPTTSTRPSRPAPVAICGSTWPCPTIWSGWACRSPFFGARRPCRPRAVGPAKRAAAGERSAPPRTNLGGRPPRRPPLGPISSVDVGHAVESPNAPTNAVTTLAFPKCSSRGISPRS